MPRGNRTAVFSGPWVGMEERENFQTDGHCQLALNVDFSRGYIEGRKGLVKTETNVPARSRMGVHRRGGKPEYILCVGPSSQTGSSAIHFNALDLNGDAISNSTQNLTTSFGEPPSKDFDCSFVAVFVAVKDPTSGLKTIARNMTLVSTRNSTYLYDPIDNPSELVQVDMSKHPMQNWKLAWGYWAIQPRGHIAVEHQGRVYYAGFDDGFRDELTSTIPEGQGDETIIDASNRSKRTLGPDFMVWSDSFDPLGIGAFNYFATEEGERITALKSFQEQLVIFTDRSVYVQTGSSAETYQWMKVSSDTGCIAPHSVVDVSGVLLFMASDGIYAFQGAGQQGAVQKLSKPVDSLFNGGHTNTYIPEKMRTLLYDRGWPFTVKQGNMHRSEALHIQSKNQVWWSLDLEGRPTESWEMALVYDYYHQAWSIYSSGALTSSQSESFMYSGVSFLSGGGKERVFVSSAAPGVFEHKGSTDTGVTSSESNIPMMYVSSRMFKENNTVSLYRPVRVKMLSHGDSSRMVNSPFWMLHGEEAHGDSQYLSTAGGGITTTSEERQYTEGKLTMHPAEGMNFFYDKGTYSGGGGGFGFTVQDADWFASKIESASVRSRSLRVSFFSGHNRTTPLRAPELVVQGIAVEIVTGDSR